MKSILNEPFDKTPFDKRLSWYCPPDTWWINNPGLVIEPQGKTDYWQRTHYGFVADNGHFLFIPQEKDFILTTRVHVYPIHQYDQAGLMVRISPQFWIKTSVEYEPEGPSRLGVVVTRNGYSDWSTQNYISKSNELELRIKRKAEDYVVEYREPRIELLGEVNKWVQIRMAHLEGEEGVPLKCGLYACSPIAGGFRAEFMYLSVEEG
jgi:uncharacterized protein